MMRKKIVSLCMALALCLSLLPATALAVDGDTETARPATLVVGNITVITSQDGYWTTNSTTGGLTQSSEAESWNVHYDESTNTLYLNGATITASSYSNNNTSNAGIYATASEGQSVSLNIVLQGENNKVSGDIGIYVYSSSTGIASLTISSEDGSNLTASGTVNPGIRVQSNGGDATLTIRNADVEAKVTTSGSIGVTVQAGSNSSASLTVNGGSLTASGRKGILFPEGDPSLNVSDSAIVRASNGIGAGINEVSVTPDGTGIVFDADRGTVYGSVTLQDDLEIGEGESLKLDDGASLDAGGHNVIVDGGTLGESLAGSLGGSVIYKVTKVELDKSSLTLDVNESETLTATITPGNATNKTVTWDSSAPGVATVDTSGKVTAVAQGSTTITATAADGSGKSATCTVTVNEAETVPVESVSLDKSNLELTEGGTDTLTATITPSNASNKSVTWSSDNESVATVTNGVVTAVTPGIATITVTTVDGGFTATCAVTVRPDIPPANPNYRITLEATQGGTVTADPTAAKAGTTVTLTPSPDAGYQVGTVAVTDRFGQPVVVTEQADGTYTFVMPNGQVTVTVTFAETPLPFTDVTEGDWFYDAVRYAYETGLMDGVGDNLFAPNSETTRAQLVTILYRLEGEPEVSGTSGFTDVEADTWYTDAVAWAAANGIVNGVSETEFAPGKDITREQLATILFRYAEAKGYDVSARADLSAYPDADQIQSYAAESVAWAVAEGLIQGFEDNTLRPAGNATRAQIATILMRFCEGVAK